MSTCAHCGAPLPEVPAPITDARRWAACPWPVRHRRLALMRAIIVTLRRHAAGRCENGRQPVDTWRWAT